MHLIHFKSSIKLILNYNLFGIFSKLLNKCIIFIFTYKSVAYINFKNVQKLIL